LAGVTARGGWAPVVGDGATAAAAAPRRGASRLQQQWRCVGGQAARSSGGGGAALAVGAERGEGEGQLGRLGSWAGPPAAQDFFI